MKLISLLIIVLLFSCPVFSKGKTEAASNPKVLIKTSMGDIEVELFKKAAPETVKNFLDLSNGKKEFRDIKTKKMVKRKFYDGLFFHRVIKDFMIQGGCPKGDGTGDPGYEFKDEINAEKLGLDKLRAVDPKSGPHPYLLIRTKEDFFKKIVSYVSKDLGIKTPEDFKKNFKKVQKKTEEMTLKKCYENWGYKYDSKLPSQKSLKGYLAMANSGPNSNGSQFFINLKNTPWLDGKHTIFGKVIKGMDIVKKIGKVKVNSKNKPDKPVIIKSIRIVK